MSRGQKKIRPQKVGASQRGILAEGQEAKNIQKIRRTLYQSLKILHMTFLDVEHINIYKNKLVV